MISGKHSMGCGRSLWVFLCKVFCMYEVRPSEKDLDDRPFLISEAVKRDETLTKAKFLVSLLDEKPQKKRKAYDEDVGNTAKPGFIVDDDDDVSDDEEELFDFFCSICDDGGELLCCEGRCMRSFHATVEAGSEFKCESLGLSDEQVEAMPNFFCKNCQYKQHQCFVCGILGSSDKLSGAQVFSCVSATCGRFYHPRCVAKLLHRENVVEAEELQKKIADGESFTCPIHKCFRCKQGEDKTDHDLQFAVCRRCPTSFHRKCLPREIGFKDDEDNGITERALEWEGGIYFYCLKHEIDEEIMTPVRNHIKFPDDGRKKKNPATEQMMQGPHFTKEDKLKEIVDRLHYYVQDDDMIVDFCCGSNDFSCLMKKKLDEVGKKCTYKNYDILQAKNDFNFEKRDWMTVQPKELPPGSQLIIGINPPFGMNCALANMFINKALEFKPKLVILIVPRETERLDKKRNPYDLVWEDDVLLAGKSYYLPGSVDVNDNQIEDWNKNTPRLCLWSHPDWTADNKAIARQHGHLSKLQEPEE